MAYIKFKVTRITDGQGNTVMSKFRRIESDLPGRDTLQPNMIYHALSFKGKTRMWLKLDEGVLDRDMLMGEEALILDSGVLDCDTLIE